MIVVCPVCAESPSKDTRGAYCFSKGEWGKSWLKLIPFGTNHAPPAESRIVAPEWKHRWMPVSSHVSGLCSGDVQLCPLLFHESLMP